MDQTTPTSVVEYGTEYNALHHNATGSSYMWTDNGPNRVNRSMHNVVVPGLAFGQRYFYHVGDASFGWSEQLVVTVPREGSAVLSIAVYGDFGDINSRSLPSLESEAAAGELDMVMHVGDFGYNLDDEDGRRGDKFMNEIQPISAAIPYMGIPGNHEQAYNFSHFTHRFSGYNRAAELSGSPGNWWYSWDFVSGGATVHVVGINTEVYFHDELKPQMEAQYGWLDADLAKAKDAGADWIIVHGHRPLYCSNSDGVDCSLDSIVLRLGAGNGLGIEKMLHKYDVDIYFGAHEHSYERTFPVFNNTYDETQANHTYVNPSMPIHIVSGSAGCQEDHDEFSPVQYGNWSVVRSTTYGYGHLRVHNTTHLFWEQLLDEGRQGTDELWVVRDPKLAPAGNLLRGAVQA